MVMSNTILSFKYTFLRKALTSTNVDDRCKGTGLLANIQHGLPKEMLQEKECMFVFGCGIENILSWCEPVSLSNFLWQFVLFLSGIHHCILL